MTNFGLRYIAAAMVGKGGGCKPPLTIYKAIPFQAMTVAEFVCMVSIFCIVLPQFVIAMTIIFYSETSIKQTLGKVPKVPA